MRLLISFDSYNGLLFAEGAPVGPIMEALNGARVVRSEGYGADEKYIPHDQPIQVKVLATDAVGLPDAADSTVWVEAYKKSQETVQKQQIEIYRLQQEVKKLTPAVTA